MCRYHPSACFNRSNAINRSIPLLRLRNMWAGMERPLCTVILRRVALSWVRFVFILLFVLNNNSFISSCHTLIPAIFNFVKGGIHCAQSLRSLITSESHVIYDGFFVMIIESQPVLVFVKKKSVSVADYSIEIGNALPPCQRRQVSYHDSFFLKISNVLFFLSRPKDSW